MAYQEYRPGASYPPVEAWPRRDGCGFVTDNCPFCGFHHWHGAAYGLRHSHCFSPFVGGIYDLIPATKPRPHGRHLARRPTWRQVQRWKAAGVTVWAHLPARVHAHA